MDQLNLLFLIPAAQQLCVGLLFAQLLRRRRRRSEERLLQCEQLLFSREHDEPPLLLRTGNGDDIN